jgi:Ca-activated chloride channel family protein
LGVGTAAGAMIPDGNGGLVKDDRGAVVLSKLESSTLRELAEATNGVYQDASSWIDLAALVSSTVETGKKGAFTEKNTVRLVERFQWPLGLALWCLFVSFYYEFPVRPKPRNLKLGPAQSATRKSAKQSATALLAFAFLVAGLVSPSRIQAEEAASAPAPVPLSKIVGRLATQPQTSAQDWAEFAQETVLWGSRLKSSQQPVPEGPVRDALTAVDLGSKNNAKTADWPKLREQLQALLEKPDDQKKDQQDQQKNQDQSQDQKDQKQDQQKNDQQKQDQQKQQDQKKSSPDSNQSQDPESSKNPPEKVPANSKKEPPSQNNESAFGDMKNQEKPPSPPPENTQQVGGAPKKPEGEQPPIDPSLALPLQKLDQLRNQDSPAELFKMMEGEKQPTTNKKTKDW